VQNFDYSHSQIDAAHPDEPNMMLDSNHGFVSFGVPINTGVTVTDLRFDDTDTDSTNDWASSLSSDHVTWTAPAGSNSLDWGTMYHFEFVANAPPTATGTLQLVGIATDTEPEQDYTLDTLVPQAQAPDDTIFQNGFD